MQLAQLKQVEHNLKQNRYQTDNLLQSFLPEAQPTVSSVLTKSLSSFPMNFEDMLSTGLKLAEQSSHKLQNMQHSSPSLQHSSQGLQHLSPSLQTQSVGQMIQPRGSPQGDTMEVKLLKEWKLEKSILFWNIGNSLNYWNCLKILM